jgi:hypothetical protein
MASMIVGLCGYLMLVRKILLTGGQKVKLAENEKSIMIIHFAD